MHIAGTAIAGVLHCNCAVGYPARQTCCWQQHVVPADVTLGYVLCHMWPTLRQVDASVGQPICRGVGKNANATPMLDCHAVVLACCNPSTLLLQNTLCIVAAANALCTTATVQHVLHRMSACGARVSRDSLCEHAEAAACS